MANTVPPPRPTHLPHGRWLGDLAPWSKAERALVSATAKGEFCSLGDVRPDAPTDANTIRASIIRFLLLGGDSHHPIHESGVGSGSV